jgi:tetratricopeptide (TPR) repeat protein
MKQKGFLKGVSMKVCVAVFLFALLPCGIAAQNTDALSLDEAIERSVREFQQKTSSPRRVAIVQFDTEDEALSEYIMEEIAATLVNFDFEVAERKNLDFVRKELDLQYSGEVDDETMAEIGRFLGAESVLVGALQNIGSTYRYRLNSINVEKAVREIAIRLDVRNDSAFNTILESLRYSKSAASKTAVPKPVAQPKTPGAFLDRGILFATRGDFALAIEDFTEAIKLNPDFASAYLLRSRALLASVSKVTDIADDFSSISSIRNYTAANKPVYDKALADANTAIKLDYTSYNAYRLRGSLYIDMGNYDRAIADYNQMLRITPEDADAYIRRGGAYWGKKDYDRTIADFTQAIRIDPNNANAYNNRGLAYANKQDYDRAIADYTQAIRITPEDADAYIRRGGAYWGKKDYDRAIADFTQAIRIDTNDATAYYNRGLTYANKKDYDRAIADYNQVIRIDPDHASAYNNRGEAYRRKEDYDRAIADFNQTIRIDPDHAFAYNNRGLAYYNKGDYDRAITDYTQALRIDPDYTNAYVNRGNAYGHKGDKNRARADWRKALELDPNNENAQINLTLP